jgi:hypothetical protein
MVLTNDLDNPSLETLNVYSVLYICNLSIVDQQHEELDGYGVVEKTTIVLSKG